MRRVAFAFAFALGLGVLSGAPADASSWVRPVRGPVARPFEPPQTRFGPGHVGVDLRALPGTPVRAAGSGVVVFAGPVAGTLHVVVRHANGWRTSYSFLMSVRRRRGRTVDAGEVLGTTGGRGVHHDGSVLHFGLRIGDQYVDPMRLFGEVDLAALVHLAPVAPGRGPTVAEEHRGLVAGLPLDDNPLVCATWIAGMCGS